MAFGFAQSTVDVRTSDGRNCTLLSTLTYVSKSGETIVIPIGTTTDGASVPRGLWETIPPFGTYWRATILHDYLYRYTTRPKHECDALLLEAMGSLGVEWAIRDIIYDGVVVGGQAAFDADRHVPKA